MKRLGSLLLMLLAFGVSPAAAANPRVLPVDCAECPRLVVVPAGTFRMGAEGGEQGRPEGPPHQVRIARPFALGVTEVTHAQFAAFVAATGYRPGTDCRSWDQATRQVSNRQGADWRMPTPGAKPQPAEPIVCVSWRDAKAYAAWLSGVTGKAYRLPTEAEWEYAARAGSRTGYFWGDLADDACKHANLYDLDGLNPTVSARPVACRDGFAAVAPVGSFAANGFGLHDMTGNVWEWVEDCYVAPFAADVPTNGSAYQLAGSCPRRSVRGGSWITAPDRNRVAWRGRDAEDFVNWIFGFRIARDLSAAEVAR